MRKMKKTVSLLLSVLLVLTLLPLSTFPGHATEIVDSGYCGGEGDGTNLTWTLDSDSLLKISGVGTMSQSPWSDYNDKIKTVVIETGVTSIGDFAFPGCTGLTSISIPDSVTSIGHSAFYGCTGLRKITIPKGVTCIEGQLFKFCENLISVDLPNGIESIGVEAFMGCINLKEISLPDSLKTIDYDAFRSCRSLTEVILPAGIEVLSSGTFASCKELGRVVINKGTQIFDFVGDSMGTYAHGAFQGCEKLKHIVLPDGMENIGVRAFAFCSSLESVTIPTSVSIIEEDAFASCTELKDIYYFGSAEQWQKIKIDNTSSSNWSDQSLPYCNNALFEATIHYHTEHTFGEWSITTPATYAAEGEETRVCSVCGLTDKREIPRLVPPAIDAENAKEAEGSVYAKPDQTASAILALAGDGAKLLNADGTEAKKDDALGSGMVLVKPDGTKETIIVKGDNDGDGKVTASDARYALRSAVDLETPNGWKKDASLVDGGEKITASDARLILRAAVELEKLKLY